MPGFIGQGKVQFFDNNNTFLSGGQVWVYLPESTTVTNVYTDILSAVNGTNPQPNPVPLNSRGEAIIVITGPVDLVVEAADINPSTGHGSVIWTIPNFAVADAETDVVGSYHFLNNTIADINNNPAFAFNAVANAINMVYISSNNASNPPTIAAVTSSGTDTMDLSLSGQEGISGGSAVRVAKYLKVQSLLSTNRLNLFAGSSVTDPCFITNIGSTTSDIILQSTGNLQLTPGAVSGTTTISGNVSIVASGLPGNLTIAGALSAGSFTFTNFTAGTVTSTTINNSGAINTASLVATGSITTSGTGTISSNTTIAAVGDINSAVSVTTPSVKYTNGSFKATVSSGTLAGNTTITMPNFTCSFPQADGAANDPLVTNGSGTMSLGSTSIALKNSSNRVTLAAPTLAGNKTVTLPAYTCTMPAADGTVGQQLITDGSGVWSFSNNDYGLVRAHFDSTSTTPQVLNAGATTKLQFPVKDIDPNSLFDAVTNYRYTPVRLGYYKITFISTATNGPGSIATLTVNLYKNGVDTGQFCRQTINISLWGNIAQTFIAQCTTNTDYFELFALQGSAGVVNLYQSTLIIERV